MAHTDIDALVVALRNAVRRARIVVDPNYIEWRSGVYAVVDCVFSSQSKYDSMVLPILRQRLPRRLPDRPELRFSDFIRDVDSFGPAKWDRYGREVMANMQVIAGRRKVEVCYDIARFFSLKGLETRADIRSLPDRELEALVMGPLQNEIRGVGPALARYLLILLGLEGHIKPDVMILRFFAGLTSWKPRASDKTHAEIIRSAITAVAAELGTTPSRLDNAIWQYQRGQGTKQRS